ncbi:hypothetical protein [Aquisphaera insulae]|uniref:hypothetical protein n=1 Tax=Aquisphaera insulae TaxID=2712864 RepID=UPI0013EA7BA8|nr:hypothetical protein [Aquisphaera insulae]
MTHLSGIVVASLLAACFVAVDEGGGASRPSKPSPAWPAEIRAELERVDAMHTSIVKGGSVEGWRFETVRAGYQELLKKANGQPGLEDALRDRLARVSRDEQAARAAREIEAILAKSRRRDADVAKVRRDLSRLDQARARSFDAIGFIQPSSRIVDGRKLFVLIGRQGKAVAFLDIPPGINPGPYYASRAGVRGQVRFNADLGARLIIVRDLVRLDLD